MAAILLEGVLFIAGLAVAVALVAYGVLGVTPWGVAWRERANRRRLEREAALTCPIHGAHAEGDLARTPSGARVCPQCYSETLHGSF